MKNCDAMCDAHQISAPLHLWLRNKTFYSRMELPRINGKRRYKRVSLHTSNYYEARAIMAEQQELLNNIKELRQLYRQLRFEDSGFPYPNNAKMDWIEDNDYDLMYPDEVAKAPPQIAILRRNDYIAKNTDYIVCYVKRNSGGVEKARKRKKKIINLAEFI